MCENYFCIIGVRLPDSDNPVGKSESVVLAVVCEAPRASDEIQDAIQSRRWTQVRAFHSDGDAPAEQCYVWTDNGTDAYASCLSACYQCTSWRAMARAAIESEQKRDEEAIRGEVEFVPVVAKPVCNCGADRTGPSAEAHDLSCPAR